MRRRLALLFVLSSAAAGCSLLVDFDRGKIPAFEETDGAPDGATVDATADAPQTDSGGGDVQVVDAPVTDAPVTDAPATDAADASDAADARDANDGASTTDANDGGTVDAADANDGASTTDANDGGTTDAADAGSDAADAADANDAADAADAAVASQYCAPADFVDLTGQATATITFPTTSTPAQYTPHCIRVTAGTTVTFSGDFAAHPLTEAGGSSGSPIPASTTTANDGGSVGDVDVTFPNAGTYDFKCGNHPTIMNGSVEVVP